MPATTRDHIIYARWLLKMMHADLTYAAADQDKPRARRQHWMTVVRCWDRIARGEDMAPDGRTVDVGTVGYLILDYLRAVPLLQPGSADEDEITLASYGPDATEYPGRRLTDDEYFTLRRDAQLKALLKQAFGRK